MFGQNRTVRGERTEFFELLSIAADGDRVAYIAQPRGAAPTRFEMTALTEQSVTFANPQHDFPKRIRYRLVDGDRLRATVDDGSDDGQRLEFAWRRVR